ncbi:MAG TPA: DUF1858 domain-containing protein [bacterium]|nr:DUF1858 domain-containing protein [bacterium]
MSLKDTSVERLLEEHPAAADWLLKRGIVCLRCGEPFWGTLAELLGNKGYAAGDVEKIVAELNAFLEKGE